jgi:CysZ protein
MSNYLAALRQFATDPRLWKLLVFCFLLSCVVFAALWAGLGWALGWLAGRVESLATVLQWGGWIGSFIVALLLFPALFSLTGNLFYESVADAVDARHFPDLPPADGAPLWPSIVSGLKYFILFLVLNALALPLYLMLLWVAGAGAALYVIVNGILFGREQFDAVALRRFPPGTAAALRRKHRFRLFRHGAVTSLLGLVPFVNFLAPLLGIAAMTHLVNRLAATQGLPRPDSGLT